MTFREKITAILLSDRCGRAAERQIFASIREQIDQGGDEASIVWNVKALIDHRYQWCVVDGKVSA